MANTLKQKLVNCNECTARQGCKLAGKDFSCLAGEGEKMDISTLIDNTVKDEVRKAGFPVHMNSEYCHQWRATHENCEGCESSEGCKMVAEVLKRFAMAMAAMILIAAEEE